MYRIFIKMSKEHVDRLSPGGILPSSKRKGFQNIRRKFGISSGMNKIL
jgi:hypothetical protein